MLLSNKRKMVKSLIFAAMTGKKTDGTKVSGQKNSIQWISTKISYVRTLNHTNIVITPRIEKWKESLLFGWMVAWTLTGIGVLVVTAGSSVPQDQRMYIVIFMLFWAYFEILAVRAWRWRKFGNEFISIDNQSITIKKAVGRYGKAICYFTDNVTAFEVIETSDKSFMKQLDSSSWIVGGEMLHFKYMGKMIRFGRQLPYADATSLKLFIEKEIRHHKSNFPAPENQS